MKIAIVGVSGAVGQEFLRVLDERNFPFDELVLFGSARSAGQVYNYRGMDYVVKELKHNDDFMGVDYAFVSAGGSVSKEFADTITKHGTVMIDNSSAFRMDSDVPLVVPEINPDHMNVIEFQKKRLGTTRGFVAVKPNCSIQSYAPVLTAWKEFEPVEVVATTYQAISGAGKNFKDWPEMVGNIIPFIGGEEEKSEKEPLKIWGKVEDTEPSGTIENGKKIADLKYATVEKNDPVLTDEQHEGVPNEASYKVYVGKNGSQEIDFIAEQSHQKIYLQVAAHISDKSTAEREFGALRNIQDNFPKYVLTLDQDFLHSEDGVEAKYLPEFILDL